MAHPHRYTLGSKGQSAEIRRSGFRILRQEAADATGPAPFSQPPEAAFGQWERFSGWFWSTSVRSRPHIGPEPGGAAGRLYRLGRALSPAPAGAFVCQGGHRQ